MDVWAEEEDENSSFTIQGITYIDCETKKQVPLSDRIKNGQIFYYSFAAHRPEEIELRCKVAGMTPLLPPEGPCCILARNTTDVTPCCMCGVPAEFLVTNTDVFDPFDEMDGENYYCIDCLMAVDTDCAILSPVANSPCSGASFSLDDLEATLDWYPPGWDIDDLVSVDAQDIVGSAIEITDGDPTPHAIFGKGGPVVMMEQEVLEDMGYEIEMFLIDEEEFNRDFRLSEEIVRSFCTVMYGICEEDIDHWDAATLRETLLGHMVRNPHATPEWAEQFVPVLCRFLESAAANGRDVDTEALFPALLEAEPEFIRRIAARNNWEIETNPGYTGLSEVDVGEGDDFVDRLLSAMADLTKEAEESGGSAPVPKTLLDLLNRKPDDRSQMIAHQAFIAERCGEFCRTRPGVSDIEARCRDIVEILAAHPDKILLQGFMEEWSGAIVWVAWDETGRIKTVEDMCHMGDEISDFFCVTIPNVQSRVVKIIPYLKEVAGVE